MVLRQAGGAYVVERGSLLRDARPADDARARRHAIGCGAIRPASHVDAADLAVAAGTRLLAVERTSDCARRTDLGHLVVPGDHELIYELPTKGELSLPHASKQNNPFAS